MWSIAMAPVSFSENRVWFGIGLWGLLVCGVGSLVVTTLSGNTLASLTSVSREPQPPLSARDGFLQKLSPPLPERTPLPITNGGQEEQTETHLRALPPNALGLARASSESPRFVVSCSATMVGDTVSIEVRLTDPQTKKLISVTNLEGRPEDLKQEIRARFRGDGPNSATGAEGPAEQAVHAAIVKAATWISESTSDSVIVQASMTKVKEIPSLQSATLLTVRQGTRLQKIGTDGDWIRIRLESGEFGWVYGEVVA